MLLLHRVLRKHRLQTALTRILQHLFTKNILASLGVREVKHGARYVATKDLSPPEQFLLDHQKQPLCVY